MMSFNEYQNKTAKTAVYPGQRAVAGLAYCGLGLGEAGEVQGKIKKVIRDDDGVLTNEAGAKIAAELGDLLWYISQTATEIGVKLEDVANGNLVKLASRHERGVIQGSGDDR